jgi:hypothetical protein
MLPVAVLAVRPSIAGKTEAGPVSERTAALRVTALGRFSADAPSTVQAPPVRVPPLKLVRTPDSVSVPPLIA